MADAPKTPPRRDRAPRPAPPVEQVGPRVDVGSPEYNTFAERLATRLGMFEKADFYDEGFYRHIDKVVESARRGSKLDLPPMTPLILRKERVVEVVRADMTRLAISQTVAYLVKKYHPTPPEVMWTILRSFPHYRFGPAPLAPLMPKPRPN